jgi:hypothetical protein
MSKNEIKTGFIMIALMGFFISGCVKDDTLLITNNKVVTAKVSFSKDLVPLFTSNCATSGCHVADHQPPDLEAADAYNSLKALNMLNLTNPQSSLIYERLSGAVKPSMPMNAPNNPSNINNLVLAWIKQGALNN